LDDIALLQYTSGTTGTPKGAILTHRNLRANAMQGRAWVPGLHEGEETFYGVLPLFHAYGMTLCLTFAMSIGAKLVLFPKYDAKLVADAAKKSPPTFLPAVPPIYDQLARSAERGDVDLKSVRFAISGAMSLPVETVTRWEEATGGLLVEGYGMTETSPVALGNPLNGDRRPGTLGLPFPSTEIRVVDPTDVSHVLPQGERGELLIRGPQVFAGYWQRPDETADQLLDDGWLRTGDVVTVDDTGWVVLVDRLKELIVSGGFKVYPSQVEDGLRLMPGVADVAVVGIPGGDLGETVVAAVVLDPGATGIDLESVRSWCEQRVARYALPRRLVVLEDLPRSQVGKVLRRQVRDVVLAQ
jgi:long-chain acyl-CoA synthetase